MQTRSDTKARAWAELLASWAEIGGGAIVLTLERVADDLYAREILYRRRRRGPDGEVVIGRRRRALARAMKEVDEATRGMPFRLETAGGPLFAWDPVACFANPPDHGARPAWNGDYRATPENLRRAAEVV